LGTSIASAAVAIVMLGFLNDLGFRRRDPAVWRKFDGTAVFEGDMAKTIN
jgi:hypothetical protein